MALRLLHRRRREPAELTVSQPGALADDPPRPAAWELEWALDRAYDLVGSLHAEGCLERRIRGLRIACAACEVQRIVRELGIR